MAEVACCKELTCVLSDWMIFNKALRASAIGMTLFSHAAGIFRRNLWHLKQGDAGFGEASIPEHQGMSKS
jgi:hypothetical protein